MTYTTKLSFQLNNHTMQNLKLWEQLNRHSKQILATYDRDSDPEIANNQELQANQRMMANLERGFGKQFLKAFHERWPDKFDPSNESTTPSA